MFQPSSDAVQLSHDGDVWRATLGEHAANSLDPFQAIVLVIGKAQEAGFEFAKPSTEKAADETPTV